MPNETPILGSRGPRSKRRARATSSGCCPVPRRVAITPLYKRKQSFILRPGELPTPLGGGHKSKVDVVSPRQTKAHYSSAGPDSAPRSACAMSASGDAP